MTKIVVKIFFDGSCWNGKRIGHKKLSRIDKSQSTMGIGVVAVVNNKAHRSERHTAGIGSNNIAEWMGAVLAFKMAEKYYEEFHDVECRVYTDSQMVANQFNGHWQIKAKNKEFVEHYNQAKEIARRLPHFHRLNWIPREENSLADAQSKLANPYHIEKENRKAKQRQISKNLPAKK